MANPTSQTEGRPSYLDDHSTACEEIGTLSWLIARVVQLDDDADQMTAARLRAEVRRIAGMARARPSVLRARQVPPAKSSRRGEPGEPAGGELR